MTNELVNTLPKSIDKYEEESYLMLVIARDAMQAAIKSIQKADYTTKVHLEIMEQLKKETVAIDQELATKIVRKPDIHICFGFNDCCKGKDLPNV